MKEKQRQQDSIIKFKAEKNSLRDQIAKINTKCNDEKKAFTEKLANLEGELATVNHNLKESQIENSKLQEKVSALQSEIEEVENMRQNIMQLMMMKKPRK